MEPRIQAALIAAISALAGVIIGGAIQVFIKDREILREKKIAEGAVCIYLCKLRDLFLQFSEKEDSFKSLALSIAPNENNKIDLNKIIELAEKHDPFLLVKLFDLRQLLGNIRIYSEQYFEMKKDGEKYERLEEVVGCMNVDGRHGIKCIDECIKHAFNKAENETREHLIRDEDFDKFVEKYYTDKPVQRWLIKHGFKKKI